MTRLAGNMGWGKTPDEWSGRIAVNIQFPAATNDAPSMHKVLQNLTYVAIPMVDPGYCHPRAGRFNLNISFDPRSTVLAGNVSSDGGTYNLVSPIYATLYTDMGGPGQAKSCKYDYRIGVQSLIQIGSQFPGRAASTLSQPDIRGSTFVAALYRSVGSFFQSTSVGRNHIV